MSDLDAEDGKLVVLADDTKRDVHGAFQRLVGRTGEPMIRLAVRQAMRISSVTVDFEDWVASHATWSSKA